MSADVISELVEMASAQQLIGIFIVSAITLVFYDYCSSVDKEVKYVWRREWNVGKVLFLALRYLPFIDLPTMAYQELSSEPSQLACSIALHWFMSSYFVACVLADAVIGLRTWAIWDRNTFCSVIIALAWIGTVVVALVGNVQNLVSSTYISPFPGMPGCVWLNTSPEALARAYYAYGAYQAVVFSATVLRGILHLRNEPSQLLRTLYRDAFLASFCLFVLAIANIVLLQNAPTWAYGLSLIFRAMNAILPGRIILNVREAAMSLDGWDVTREEHWTTTRRVTAIGPEGEEGWEMAT